MKLKSLTNIYLMLKRTWDNKAQLVTAPLRYGGGSANTNSSAINKHCAFRQVSASNPPQRKAANRQGQLVGVPEFRCAHFQKRQNYFSAGFQRHDFFQNSLRKKIRQNFIFKSLTVIPCKLFPACDVSTVNSDLRGAKF